MNRIFTLLLMACPLLATGQFNKQVLRNAPSSISCNDTNRIVIHVEFYFNVMPGSNSSELRGGPSIGDYVRNSYVILCPSLKFEKWFYFYGDELIVQSIGLKTPAPWHKGGKHENSVPDIIVAEFTDTRTGEYIYLKQQGPFSIGQVE